MIEIFKVPIPDIDSDIKNNKKLYKEFEKGTKFLINKILDNTYINYTKEYLKENISKDDIKRIYYWSHQQVTPICTFLREWLENQDYLFMILTVAHKKK